MTGGDDAGEVTVLMSKMMSSRAAWASGSRMVLVQLEVDQAALRQERCRRRLDRRNFWTVEGVIGSPDRPRGSLGPGRR